jgi:chromosome segregation ATPase
MEENLDGNFSNVNALKNKKEQKDILSDNILAIPKKCRRCRFNLVEIMCKECYPFIYFCSNCSKILHLMESKQNHQIIDLKELNPNLFEEFNNNNENNVLNEFDKNPNTDEITKNYINDIKSIYLKEKNNFLKKSFKMEKYYEKSKNGYIQKINELTEQLEKFENKKNEEIKILEKTKYSEFKNILDNKDSKIKCLLQKIEELNSQMSAKNKQMNDLKQLNSNLTEIINQQKKEIELLNKQNDDLKGKMDRINYLFNEEKKEMTKAYEEQILKINMDYTQHKDKMKFILFQRENEINSIKNEFHNEIKGLKKELEECKYNNKNLNNEYNELNNIMHKKQYKIKDS